jgi:hypothetical protein
VPLYEPLTCLSTRQEPAILEAAWAVVHTLQTEQRHNESSSYVFSELPNDGRGVPTSYTGESYVQALVS